MENVKKFEDWMKTFEEMGSGDVCANVKKGKKKKIKSGLKKMKWTSDMMSENKK